MNDAAADSHRRWAVECFNRAWSFIELPRRTADENAEMLLLAVTSLWHWTQRSECGERERSIGCWQVSRCAALAGHAALALDFAERSLRHAKALEPFYRGYAHEAAARAAGLDQNPAARRSHLEEARRCADAVDDAEDRDRLLADLDAIELESSPPAT